MAEMCKLHPNSFATSTCTDPSEPGPVPTCERCHRYHYYFHDPENFKLLNTLFDEFLNDIKFSIELLPIDARHCAPGSPEEKQLAELTFGMDKIHVRIKQFGPTCRLTDPLKVQKARNEAQAIKAVLDTLNSDFDRFCTAVHDIEVKRMWTPEFLLPAGNLMAYYNMGLTVLRLFNTVSKRTLSIPLSRDLVASCRTSSLFGGPSCVIAADAVFLIGGFDSVNASDKVVRLSLRDPVPKPTLVAPLRVGRFDTGVVQLCQRYIFAVTGAIYPQMQYGHTASCECYDIKANKWSNVSPVNEARSVPGICTFKDRFIYIYAGEIGLGVDSSKVETYDILEDERGWSIVKTSLESDPANGFKESSNALACQNSDHGLMFFCWDSEYIVGEVVGGSDRIEKAKVEAPWFTPPFYYVPCAVHRHVMYQIRYYDNNVIDGYDLIMRKLISINDPTLGSILNN